jgi:MiaB-like tRNA modifying enzyme
MIQKYSPMVLLFFITVRVYFETYGCTMNQGDTEIMRGIAAEKHEIVEDPDECDVAVINSCGVVQRTENKVVRRKKLLMKMGKKVLIAGCLPRINFSAVKNSDGVLSPGSIGLIGEALDTLSRGGKFANLSSHPLEKIQLPRDRKKGVIAVMPISEGCLGRCSYCATKNARGRLKSFQPEGIVREVREALARGYREIQLTAQDTAAYGVDIGERLPDLLHRIMELEGEFRVRVGMMNPETALPIYRELMKCFSGSKVYKFLHLPVQTGDDALLEDMCRNYAVKDFTWMAKNFKKHGGTLSTDIIVGYPGEDDDSFMRTYKLVEEIRPDILNIKRFSPRTGTKAAKLKDMPDRLKKERSRELSRLHRKIGLEENRRFIGKKLLVLTTERGKKECMLGRTNSYKQVVLHGGELGEFKRIKIRDATSTYLIS